MTVQASGVWTPRRALKAGEQYIALSDIKTGTDAAVGEIERVLSVGARDYAEASAESLAKADRVMEVVPTAKSRDVIVNSLARRIETLMQWGRENAAAERVRARQRTSVTLASTTTLSFGATDQPKPSPEAVKLAAAAYDQMSNDVLSRLRAHELRLRAAGIDHGPEALTAYLAERISTRYLKDNAAGKVVTAFSTARHSTLFASADDSMTDEYGAYKVGYSALLDSNTCGPCQTDDGKQGTWADVPKAPNARCEGGVERCRCINYLIYHEDL